MPDLGDLLAVLRSLASAVGISIAAYGFGRPLARMFELAREDRLERGIHSLVLGFPAAGLTLAVCGLLGCLGTVSVSLVTLIGLLLASVEVACSIADHPRIGGGFVPWGRILPRSSLHWAVVCLVTAVLTATLMSALVPPTEQALLARMLDAPNNALLAGTFWNGDQASLQLISLTQIWSLWGLALDGPVAANLVHWQVTIVVASAAVLLARHLVSRELAWLAGCLVLISPVCWSQLSAGAATSLAAVLVLLASAGVCQRGRRAVGQLNFALAAFVGSFPGSATDVVEFSLWQHPFLLIALGGLMLGTLRQRMVFLGILAGLLAAHLLPNAQGLIRIVLPGVAVAGAVGVTVLLRLPTPARGAFVGLLTCLTLLHVGDVVRSALPKVVVALGGQSRESYLLAACGSYRAATVFNQIRLPEQRLFSTSSGCLYFTSPTVTSSAFDGAVGVAGFTPAQIAAEAQRQGCDYVLLAQPSTSDPRHLLDSNASRLACQAGSSLNVEKFAGAVEVIPIVEYEFADEYQRTTRYRLWKLQSRRAAVSPTFESATSGKGVSSRPRPLTR
jgi:hypothetical protein